MIVRACFLWCMMALPVLANNGNDGGRGGDAPDGGSFAAGLSAKTTARVTRTLTRDFQRCQLLAAVYQFDCFRQVYARAIRPIAGNSAYLPARRALEQVEARVERIVETQADPDQPPLRTAARRYVPIRPAAVPRARAALDDALDEASTVLLRADAGAGDFAEIAAALETQKTLLRAALWPLIRRWMRA